MRSPGAVQVGLGVILFCLSGMGIGILCVRSQAIQFARERFGGDEPKEVVIPEGAHRTEVTERLAAAGVISDAVDAERYLQYLRGERERAPGGRYVFRGAHLPDEIFDQVYAGQVVTVQR